MLNEIFRFLEKNGRSRACDIARAAKLESSRVTEELVLMCQTGWVVRIPGASVHWELAGLGRRCPELSTLALTDQEKLLAEALSENMECAARDLARECDIRITSVRSLMTGLIKKGLAVRLARDVWCRIDRVNVILRPFLPNEFLARVVVFQQFMEGKGRTEGTLRSLTLLDAADIRQALEDLEKAGVIKRTSNSWRLDVPAIRERNVEKNTYDVIDFGITMRPYIKEMIDLLSQGGLWSAEKIQEETGKCLSQIGLGLRAANRRGLIARVPGTPARWCRPDLLPRYQEERMLKRKEGSVRSRREQTKILCILEDGKLHAFKEIAEKTGADARRLEKDLAILLDNGKITRLVLARWCLASAVPGLIKPFLPADPRRCAVFKFLADGKYHSAAEISSAFQLSMRETEDCLADLFESQLVSHNKRLAKWRIEIAEIVRMSTDIIRHNGKWHKRIVGFLEKQGAASRKDMAREFGIHGVRLLGPLAVLESRSIIQRVGDDYWRLAMPC